MEAVNGRTILATCPIITRLFTEIMMRLWVDGQVDPSPESAESMTGYQYAMNSPMMMNDPLGDKARLPVDIPATGNPGFSSKGTTPDITAGDMANEFETSSGGIPLGFGGGGGGGDGGGYSDLLAGTFESRLGAWEQNSTAAGLAVSQITYENPNAKVSYHQALSGFENGSNSVTGGYSFNYTTSTWDNNTGLDVTNHTYCTSFNYGGGNQGGDPPLTHAQELAKYGQIITAYNFSVGASLAQFGATVETGVIMTDKGWARAYKTIYYSPGFASPSGALGFSPVYPMSNKYLPTFSDWKGAMVGFSGSIDFISGNVGFTSTYFVWGLGLSAAPESLTIPVMKGVNGSGSMNLGITSWIGAPFQVGNLNLPGANQRYINTMQYQGGY